MNTVSKVIFDALSARRSVVLPGVGLLEVKRRKARKISETRIIPPQNVVTFTAAEPGDVATVAGLLAAAGIPEPEADAAYRSWLDGAQVGGSVLIEDAGEITGGKFVVAEPLHTALNPVKEEDIITMEKERRRGPAWVWVVVGILAAALISGGIWCWKKGCFECTAPAPVEVVPAIVTPAPEPAAGDTAAATADARPSATPGFHIIAGVFSIESNADNFMAKVKRENPELTPEKIVSPRNGWNMVSIYRAATEREAYNKMALYWDIDLYLWVYEQK